MNTTRTGGCQCGEVRYEISGEPIVIYACHCAECQRQSGSAFAMAAVFPLDSFRLTKGRLNKFERQAESGRRMVCWFCGDCGTRIYHSPAGIAGNCNIKPGTLDDTSWLKPAVHVWTKSARRWVAIPQDAARHDTQPMDRGWLRSQENTESV